MHLIISLPCSDLRTTFRSPTGSNSMAVGPPENVARISYMPMMTPTDYRMKIGYSYISMDQMISRLESCPFGEPKVRAYDIYILFIHGSTQQNNVMAPYFHFHFIGK
jgi:hypothetical protein